MPRPTILIVDDEPANLAALQHILAGEGRLVFARDAEAALRLARDVGLGLVERLPALKKVFIREAAGFTGDVPKLLKGEVL